MYALLSHYYSFSVEQITDMTMAQVNLYISQIPYAAPLFRIRYYLRDIKNALYSMFSEKGTYHPDPEYDEDETEETRKAEELYRLQLEAIKHGIKPPQR